jgi:hypothetical protein
MTVKELLNYIATNNIPEEAEILFEDGTGSSVNIETAYFEQKESFKTLFLYNNGKFIEW